MDPDIVMINIGFSIDTAGRILKYSDNCPEFFG